MPSRVSALLASLAAFLLVLGQQYGTVSAACGDGTIDGGDICDDGNTSPLDGCSATCTVEPGWTCSGTPSTCGNAAHEVIGMSAHVSTPCALFASGHMRCWGHNYYGSRTSHRVGDEAGEISSIDYLTLPIANNPSAVYSRYGGHCFWYTHIQQQHCIGYNGGNYGIDYSGHYGYTYDHVITASPASVLPATTHISHGYQHTCMITTANQIKCFGYCAHGACGGVDGVHLGDSAGEIAALNPVVFATADLPTTVDAGYYSTCATFNNGRARCWGYDLGTGVQIGSGVPGAVGKTPAEMLALDFLNFNDTGVPIVEISHSYACTCVRYSNGRLRCFGRLGCPGFTQTLGESPGDLSTAPYITFSDTYPAVSVVAGAYRGCALFNTPSGNRMRCWGYNAYAVVTLDPTPAYVGDDPTELPNLPYMDLGTTAEPIQIATTFTTYHTCVVFGANAPAGVSRLRCWGSQDGPLPYDLTPQISSSAALSWAVFKTTDPVISISKKFQATMCALFDVTGTTKTRCWGSNVYGESGQAIDPPMLGGGAAGEMTTLTDVPIPHRIEQLGRGMYTHPILNGGKAKSWGYTAHGHFAQPAFTYPGQRISALQTFGYLEFSDTVPMVKIGVGYYHSCGLFGERVRCWGYALYGGVGPSENTYKGVRAPTPMTSLEYLEFAVTDPVIDLSTDHGSSCAVFQTGKVICWGYNYYGQCGQDHAESIGRDDGYHLSTIPPIVFQTTHKAVQVEVGVFAACALFDFDNAGSLRIRCWGRNLHGELGVNHQTDVGKTTGTYSVSNVPFIAFQDGYPNIQQVNIGYYNTAVLFKDGRLRVWGYGNGCAGQNNNLFYGRDNVSQKISLLPYITFATTHLAIDVGVGIHSCCARFNNLRMRCWGYNIHGQAGIPWTTTAQNFIGNEAGEMATVPFITFAPGANTNPYLNSAGYHSPVTGIEPSFVWITDIQTIYLVSATLTLGTKDFYEFVPTASGCPANPAYQITALGSERSPVTQVFTATGTYKLCYKRSTSGGTTTEQTGFTLSVGPRVVPSGTLVSATENGVRTTSYQLRLTVEADTWHPSLTNGNALVDTFLTGLSSKNMASAKEAFAEAIQPQLSSASLVRDSATEVTLTFPMNDSYVITEDELLVFDIPGTFVASTLQTKVNKDITIQNSVPDIASVGGTLITSGPVSEEAIRQGGETLTVTIRGTRFVDALVQNAAAEVAQVILGLTSDSSDSMGWNAQIVPVFNPVGLTRTGPRSISLTMPPVPNFLLTQGHDKVNIKVLKTVMIEQEDTPVGAFFGVMDTPNANLLTGVVPSPPYVTGATLPQWDFTARGGLHENDTITFLDTGDWTCGSGTTLPMNVTSTTQLTGGHTFGTTPGDKMFCHTPSEPMTTTNRAPQLQLGNVTLQYPLSLLPHPSTTLTEQETRFLNISLSRSCTQEVNVTLVTSPPGQVSLSASVLTFKPADWFRAQEVTISGIADMQDEALSMAVNIMMTINSPDPMFDSAVQPMLPLTLTDVDPIWLNLTSPSTTFTEGQSNGTLSVHLVSRVPPPTPLTVSVTATDPSIQLIPATLTFGGATSDQPQLVTVYAPDDNITSPDPRVFDVVLTLVGSYPEYVTDLGTPSTLSFSAVEDSSVANVELQTVPDLVRNSGVFVLPNFVSASTALTGVPTHVDIEYIPSSTVMFLDAPNITSDGTLTVRPHPTTLGVCNLGVRFVYPGGIVSAYTYTAINVIDVPAPVVTGISPPTGPLSGGTRVVVSGNHFGYDLSAITSITLGTLPCTDITYVSYTQVSCVTSPTSSSVDLQATVTTTKGAGTGGTFNYRRSPVVTKLIPNVVPIVSLEAKTQVISLRGSDFGEDAADLKGISLAGVVCSTATWLSSKEVTCELTPALAPKVYTTGDAIPETVSTGVAIPSVSSPKFYFSAPPILKEITPSTGTFDVEHEVTITGLFFGAEDDDKINIEISGQRCTDIVRLTPETVTCKTPIFDAAPDGLVTADTTYGGTSPDPLKFTFETPPPIVSAFSPTTVVASASQGFNVTISGKFLASGSARIAGFDCVSTTTVSDRSLTCQLPAVAAAAIGVVEVETKEGRNASDGYFVVRSNSMMPATFSATPDSGDMTGGVEIVVVGDLIAANKFDLESVVFVAEGINVTSPSSSWLTRSSIQVVSPPFPAPVRASIVAQTVSGGRGVSAASFNFLYPAPVGSSGFPRLGDISSTTRVVLTGSYFGHWSNTTLAVRVGNQPCASPQWISSSRISCTIPQRSALANPEDPPFIVTANGLSSPPFKIGFRFVPKEQLCDPTCPLRAECVSGTGGQPVCECFPGWIGAECEINSVLLEPVDAETSEDYGDPLEARIRFVGRPAADVLVEFSTSSPGIAGLNDTEVTVTPENYEAGVPVRGYGIRNKLRDGTRNFQLQVASMTSTDPTYNLATAEPLDMLCKDSSPVVTGISPLVCPRNGTTMTITGESFDDFLSVVVDGVRLAPSAVKVMFNENATQVTGLPNVTRTSTKTRASSLRVAQASPSSRSGPNQIVVTVPRTEGPDGYRTLEILNAGGTKSSSDRWLYVTDDCPEEGQFGLGLDCQPCPKCGYCPGGYRVIAKAGCYGSIDGPNTGEELALLECPETCLGGPNNECVEGYTGRGCAACVEGYTRTETGECLKCPPAEGQMIFVICDIIVWFLLGMAGWLVEDRENLAHIIALMLAFQTVAGIGAMVTNALAKWLRELFSAFHLFSGNIQFLKPDCAGNINYELEFAFRLAYNVVLAIPLLIGVVATGAVSVWYHRKHYGELEATERKQHYKNRLMRCLIIWLSLMYLTITTSSLNTISCFPSGSRWLSVTDYSRTCFETPEHIAVTAASVVLLTFYTIGYPVAFYLFQKRHQAEFYGGRNHNFVESWDFLNEPFSQAHQYAWCIEFILSVFMAAGDTFLSQFSFLQFVVVGSAFVIATVYLIIWRPYRRGWENGVIILFNLAAILAITYNFTVTEGMVTEELHKKIMAYTLGAMIGLGSIVFLAIVIYYVFLRQTVHSDVEKFGRDHKEIGETYESWFREMQVLKERIAHEQAIAVVHHEENAKPVPVDLSVEDKFVFLDVTESDGDSDGEESNTPLAPLTADDSTALAASEIHLSITNSSEDAQSDTGLFATQLQAPEIREQRRGRHREPANKVLVTRPAALPIKVDESTVVDNVQNTILSWFSPAAGSIPAHWANRDDNAMSGKQVVIYDASTDAEGEVRDPVADIVMQTVTNTFDASKVGGGADNPDLNHNSIKIVKIERVENAPVWKRYVNSLEHLAAVYAKRVIPETDVKTGRPDAGLFDNVSRMVTEEPANEVYLLHGSSAAIVPVLADNGFDARVSNRDNLFGEGLYFAEASNKADEYASPDQDGVCVMILVRVALGLPFITLEPHQGIRRPPCILGHSGTHVCTHPRFDSLIGEVGPGAYLKKSREFVVYESDRAYPEFVVYYKREHAEHTAPAPSDVEVTMPEESVDLTLME